jgi:hypothetical protein
MGVGCGWLVCIKLSLCNRRHLLGLLYLRRIRTEFENQAKGGKYRVHPILKIR